MQSWGTTQGPFQISCAFRALSDPQGFLLQDSPVLALHPWLEDVAAPPTGRGPVQMGGRTVAGREGVRGRPACRGPACSGLIGPPGKDVCPTLC